MAAMAALALLLSACSVNIERNQDGSLQVDGEITAESLAAEFERDPENNSVDVRVDDGVLWLDVEGVDENGDYVANLRVELAVADGTLVVDITEAFYNGWTVPDEIRDEFNKEIAKEIKKAVNQNPDATLLSLVADDGKITTEWRVDTKDSKKG
jgi:hypothetical protein